MRRTAAAALIALLVPAAAGAWPASLRESMARDARRLVPRSLAELMSDREKEILEEAQRFPPELTQALAIDLGQGTLRPETLAALEARAGEAVGLIRERRVTEGIIRLGGLLRVPADLSDPVLTRGAEGYPAGVTREYYAFVSTWLPKIPVVLDNPASLRLDRKALPSYWQGLLGRSRDYSPVIQTELFKNGRVVDHRTLDYRSPVFGVGSLAYSRSVTAIAATWLAVWREVRGDLTRMKAPVELAPREPAVLAGSPTPATPQPIPLAGEEVNPMTAKRALLSVYRKDGIVELARGLVARGFEIISTGGTAQELRKGHVKVMGISDVTNFPEILDGRVKSLHPAIHAAILARLDEASHREALEEHHIKPVSVVVVNLYPFEDKVAKGAPFSEAVENVDIGGPTLVRAAAKNFKHVAVVVDPADYGLLLEQLDREEGVDAPTRLYFAQKAFRHTARYDAAISGYFSQVEVKGDGFAVAETEEVFPYRLSLSFEKVQDLRYGENPHQRAAFYSDLGSTLYSVAAARKLQGKELSFNNILDLDSAWRLVTELPDCACVIVKHNNPCGTAVGADPLAAYDRAWACDPVSAFGGILAFNRRLDGATARKLAEVFVEAVIAPGYDGEAKKLLAAKKGLRVMDMDTTSIHKVTGFDLRRVMGGLLAQDWDQAHLDRAKCEVVTKRKPSEDEWKAMSLAWTVCKHVKSNAIVFANAVQTVGVGAGQMSRVDAARFAALKAKLPLKGTAAASDAFFPFRDGLDELAKAGATAVIQPGGSVKDEEVIAAADEQGLAMACTNVRHFRH